MKILIKLLSIASRIYTTVIITCSLFSVGLVMFIILSVATLLAGPGFIIWYKTDDRWKKIGKYNWEWKN